MEKVILSSPFTKLSKAMTRERNLNKKSNGKAYLEEQVLLLDAEPDLRIMKGKNVVSAMTEIYRVSNKNRKVNKENKRKAQLSNKSEDNLNLKLPRSTEYYYTEVALGALTLRNGTKKNQQTYTEFLQSLNWPFSRNIPGITVEQKQQPQLTPTRKKQQPKLKLPQTPNYFLNNSLPQVRGHQNNASFFDGQRLKQNNNDFHTSSSLFVPIEQNKGFDQTFPTTPLESDLFYFDRSEEELYSRSMQRNTFAGDNYFQQRVNNGLKAQTFSEKFEQYEPRQNLNMMSSPTNNVLGAGIFSQPNQSRHRNSLEERRTDYNYFNQRQNNGRPSSYEHNYRDVMAQPQSYNIDEVNSMLAESTQQERKKTSFSYF